MQDSKHTSGLVLYCEMSLAKPRPLLPEKLRSQVLQIFHGLDHCGQKALKRRISAEYYWPKMGKDVASFVKCCHPCQMAKAGKPIRFPSSKIEVPDQRFSYLNLDIVGPLPKSRGFKYIFTILDRCSRMFQAIPLETADSESCSRAFLTHWLSMFSLPAKATSDNGNTFISQIWRGLQNSLGIKVEFTPRFRPQANGAVERQHQSLKNGLKAALLEMGDTYREKWADALPWVLLGRRAAYQEDLGCSPFQLTFGQPAVLPGALVSDPGPAPTKSEIQTLLHTLEAAADRPAVPMSHHCVDKQAYIKDINKATHVYLKLDNPQGLQGKYHGPFAIKRRVGESTIEVRTGTLKNGDERLELHSWNNAKPAYFAEGVTPFASERPKLGRPATSGPVQSPSSTEAKPAPAANPAPEVVKKVKPVETPAPSTHNMTLRDRKVNKPLAGISNAESSPPQSWSANKREIDEINASITFKSSAPPA